MQRMKNDNHIENISWKQKIAKKKKKMDLSKKYETFPAIKQKFPYKRMNICKIYLDDIL